MHADERSFFRVYDYFFLVNASRECMCDKEVRQMPDERVRCLESILERWNGISQRIIKLHNFEFIYTKM